MRCPTCEVGELSVRRIQIWWLRFASAVLVGLLAVLVGFAAGLLARGCDPPPDCPPGAAPGDLYLVPSPPAAEPGAAPPPHLWRT